NSDRASVVNFCRRHHALLIGSYCCLALTSYFVGFAHRHRHPQFEPEILLEFVADAGGLACEGHFLCGTPRRRPAECSLFDARIRLLLTNRGEGGKDRSECGCEFYAGIHIGCKLGGELGRVSSVPSLAPVKTVIEGRR